ncbi:periplasmic component of amino acid ABC-type transporter/signal transduction system, partial [Acidovorax sp. CF316]|uniref:transporter substrate-binding domain-containing protein n=1 Tax=Acidovorax sp. CF316 TaxID=1144317 RepID=UPI00026BDE35
MQPHRSLNRRLLVLKGAAATAGLGWGGSALAQGTAAPADQLERILRSKVLRVAVPQDFPPFGFTRNGVFDGFDIAVARMLAADLRVSLKTLPVASGDRMAALLEDRVDIIIASLGKTAEREKEIDFSSAYAPTYIGVFGDTAAPGGTGDAAAGA